MQECFWGPFSREIILPAEADPGRATAEMKNGVLTIRIPKVMRETKKKIVIKKQ
jgi:HSP20 family molecular chaperone IbpA